MTVRINLRELADVTAPERAFLNVYLSSPRSADALEKKLEKMRRVLRSAPEARLDKPAVAQVEKDEREYFDANVAMVRKYLKKHPLETGSLAIFACWALDFFKAIPLTAPVEDLVWIDSSPYIRPLAELEDEYENVAVVVADNRKARVFLVSSAVASDAAVVAGNVKNHVKKGGWSQKRYERRRDKQLLLYAREVVQALVKLDGEEAFRRIVLVGGKEILQIIHAELPRALRTKCSEKASDLKKGDARVQADIWEVFAEQERQSERDLWEKIRVEVMRGGLGVTGIEDVLDAARMGRVETVIVHRGLKPTGRRCRDCENLDAGPVEVCSACGSTSLFEVDLVNELVEILKQTGAEVDFADAIDTLTEAGGIAALLRY